MANIYFIGNSYYMFNGVNNALLDYSHEGAFKQLIHLKAYKVKGINTSIEHDITIIHLDGNNLISVAIFVRGLTLPEKERVIVLSSHYYNEIFKVLSGYKFPFIDDAMSIASFVKKISLLVNRGWKVTRVKPRITRSEFTILLMTANGYNSEQIASAMLVSRKTIYSHKSNASHKMNLSKSRFNKLISESAL